MNGLEKDLVEQGRYLPERVHELEAENARLRADLKVSTKHVAILQEMLDRLDRPLGEYESAALVNKRVG